MVVTSKHGELSQAVRACAMMVLAQIDAMLGGHDRVPHAIKLGSFVNSSASSTEQPVIANGAVGLMQPIFGEDVRHVRSAVGVPKLPQGAVEIDRNFAIKPAGSS